MTAVDSRQNETDIYADETQRTSQNEDNDPLPLYTLAENDPAIYSEVEQRKLGWKDGKNAAQPKTAKIKPPIEDHSAGSDVYASVNKPSKAAETSAALTRDRVQLTGLVNKGDCFSNQIYSLASNDMADTYANETTADSSIRLGLKAVSKTPSPQDGGGQTVIENNLYCH